MSFSHTRFALLMLLGVLISGSVTAADTLLLAFSRGDKPNDTAFENKSTLTLENNPQLGGQVLKFTFAAGDSFGLSRGKLSDWRAFSQLAVDVLNPASKSVGIALTIKHSASRNFRSRADVPFTLKPGVNRLRIDLTTLRNNDKSRPDLSGVQHWYVTAPGATPTLYFSDFRLVPADTAAPDSPTRRRVKTDPARLKRIRSTKMPAITAPVDFNTKQADAILSALEVFPPDNPWNEIIDEWPVHPNSKNIIASVGADKPLRYNPDMSFIIVPPNQPRVDVNVVGYPGESDKGPFPVPLNTPIEGWPAHYLRSGSKATLLDVQMDVGGQGGDRHAIVVDPTNRMLYEFFVMKRTKNGWQAVQASVFDLKTNKLRPDGWTSADAAGLPIFPAVVRYDELQRGIVEHAMRVTIRKSRRAYVAPATHFASRSNDPNFPRMGERFRLRDDFNIKGFSPPVQAILRGLKKYGMLVADNGIEWAISVAPDPRIPVLHEELRRIKGSDFEVVVAPR